jgi:two-component system KDP operon response regulator KdpE
MLTEPTSRSDLAATMPLVLVVEPETRPRRTLLSTLATSGFRSVHADSRALSERATETRPDLVLLDVDRRASDAARITARMREWTSAPILVISARVGEDERVAVLDAGANDVITKPFGEGELLARMRVWLRFMAGPGRRRVAPRPATPKVVFDRERQTLIVDGRGVHLTPREHKLFSVLERDAGKLVPEERILAALWGSPSPQQGLLLKVLVRQLRRKIEKNPAEPRRLLGNATVGYRLDVT